MITVRIRTPVPIYSWSTNTATETPVINFDRHPIGCQREQFMITERKAKTIILRERSTIDGVVGTRFRSVDGFTVYACFHEEELVCVTVRRGHLATSLFHPDDIQAVVL